MHRTHPYMIEYSLSPVPIKEQYIGKIRCVYDNNKITLNPHDQVLYEQINKDMSFFFNTRSINNIEEKKFNRVKYLKIKLK